MHVKKILALALSLLLVTAMFAGCSARSEATKDFYYNGSAVSDDAGDYGFVSEQSKSEAAGTAQTTQIALPENQKLITTVHLQTETDDLDATLSYTEERIAELGGYLESQNLNNGSIYSSHRYRSANLTVRIPADNLNQFIDRVGESVNIVSKKVSTENVTLTYISVESRITALQTEQTRLLELLAKAETMEDLLTIESRLTDVRTELERYTSQLRVLDNQISYSTVNLSIEEVKEYTQVTEPETFWDRISSGFVQSLKGVGTFFTELAVFLIVSLPYLILIAGVVAVVIVLIKRKRRKTHKKPEPPTE